MGYLPRRAADRGGTARGEECVTVNKTRRSRRSEERFDIRRGLQDSGLARPGFGLALVQDFLTVPYFLLLEL